MDHGLDPEEPAAGLENALLQHPVHFLSAEAVYSASLREEEIEGERTTSKVTLIFLKKDGEWRIVHGHFSRVSG